MSNVIRLSISRLCGSERRGVGCGSRLDKRAENREAGCDCPDSLQRSLTRFRCHVPPFRASIAAHLAGYSRNNVETSLLLHDLLWQMFASCIRNRHRADRRGNSYSLKGTIRENARIFNGNFRSRGKKVKENHRVREKLTMRVIRNFRISTSLFQITARSMWNLNLKISIPFNSRSNAKHPPSFLR